MFLLQRLFQIRRATFRCLIRVNRGARLGELLRQRLGLVVLLLKRLPQLRGALFRDLLELRSNVGRTIKAILIGTLL